MQRKPDPTHLLNVPKILATSEYNLERCLKLISDFKNAAMGKQNSKGRRDTQVNERPRTFSLEEQENFVKIVRGGVESKP